MDGTIYKNMSAGYAAYVNAIKLYDRYYYGNDESVTEQNIQDAVSALKKETEDLKSNVWTPGEGITELRPVNRFPSGDSTTDLELTPPNNYDKDGTTPSTLFYNNIIYYDALGIQRTVIRK